MVRDNYNNQGGGSSRPLYEMVNDPSTDSIVSWSENGNSFILWNQSEFCNDVLRVSHKARIYQFSPGGLGFRKVVESEQFEYANDKFVRGKPELLPEIQKRYIASLPPDAFVFKRRAEAARGIERIKALQLAMDQSSVVKNLSNLTL